MRKKSRPLLGTSRDADTHSYLVLFRDAATDLPTDHISRADVVNSGTEHTRVMVESLLDSLREKEIEIPPERVGEPTAFGAVALNVTDDVAEKVRELPEVEALIRE